MSEQQADILKASGLTTESGRRDWLKIPIKLRGAGGVLTLEAELVSEGCWKAVWVTQGSGFNLNAISGYIVRVSGDPVFLRAKTKKSAMKMVKG